LKTSDFDFDLPPEYIAQTPIEPRDRSRLLVLDRASGAIEHALFRDLPRYLHAGDVLVLNETRVIPARLSGRKIPSGGRVELLLLKQLDSHTWETLVGGKGLRAGMQVQVEAGPQAQVLEVLGGARRLVRFAEPVDPYLPQAGQMPLPPYIHQPLQDRERYQTVYSRQPGSAAAPTAGLHFTPSLLESLPRQGIQLAHVTLHVGLDTFAPVTEEMAEEHEIHTEWCQLDQDAAARINLARQQKRRIVAVGTTSVRTLETAASRAKANEAVAPYEGATALFILPGYRFRAVDVLITNFHLPRSTLIMLVSAFAGRQLVLQAYETAKKEGYRFYSFGDAMLIL
jgi:S-adenosylmethionine:tRNA ribosyltransferase-isomerase